MAGHVRSWLERAADHVLDIMQPPEAGLAYESGGHGGGSLDLADRLRAAWALRDTHSEIGEKRSALSEERSEEPDAPQSLAARLHAAAHGIDTEELADRAAALRRDREAEHAAQDAERVLAKELEQEHEAEVQRERGLGHEL